MNDFDAAWNEAEAMGGGDAPAAPLPTAAPNDFEAAWSESEAVPVAPTQEAAPVETPDQLADLVTGEPRAPQDDVLDAILNQAIKKNPERQAGVLGLARQTGLPSDVVDRRFDEVKQAVERSQYNSTKLRLERPEIADFLLKNPDAGAMVLKDE